VPCRMSRTWRRQRTFYPLVLPTLNFYGNWLPRTLSRNWECSTSCFTDELWNRFNCIECSCSIDSCSIDTRLIRHSEMNSMNWNFRILAYDIYQILVITETIAWNRCRLMKNQKLSISYMNYVSKRYHLVTRFYRRFMSVVIQTI